MRNDFRNRRIVAWAASWLGLFLSWSGTVRAELMVTRGTAIHIVASPRTALERRVVGRLTEYLGRVLQKAPEVVAALDQVPAKEPAIVLAVGKSPVSLPVAVPDGSPEAYVLATIEVDGHSIAAAVGATDLGLKRAVQRLIIEGKQETTARLPGDSAGEGTGGTEGRQEPLGWVLGEVKRAERPWIPHREWTVCPWTPGLVRGMFANPRADVRMDITRYSDKQLADYAEMFDWFGFSGCQLMETSYSYAVAGSIDAFQSWQKRLAEAVRTNGQEVSLWVWAAEFSGYGWYDPQVVALRVPGKGAFEDTATRRVFEKYYDRYARLAPLVDRVIGHFYDPGRLIDRADVFKFMRLLEEKFKAGNPKVRMGIDFWAAGPEYMQQLLDNGFGDYLLLETGAPEDGAAAGARAKLHEQAKAKGIRLGIWGWYLTEYETDQLASMYVNAQVLKGLYQQIRKEAIAVHPVEYWSEMEAHHLSNIYSMYAAGQLLWNPDRDPHELLKELVLGIWGPTNGPAVLEAVELIQDVRSGPSWETYWWRRPTYRLGTDRPAVDLKRAEAALAALMPLSAGDSRSAGLEPARRGGWPASAATEGRRYKAGGPKAALSTLKTYPAFVPKFPLPVPPETLVELMMPHLQQIRLYAEFRLKTESIRKAAREGADHQTLQTMLDDAWKPIPEFNTWVGTFGTPELREQERQVRALCGELKLAMNTPPSLRSLEADRVYQVIQSRQRNRSGTYQFKPANLNEFHWDKAKLADRVQKLVEDGLIESVPDGMFQLKPKP